MMCFGSSQNLQPRRPQPVSKRITQQRSNSALYTMHIYLAALASSCLLGLGVALVSVTTTVSIHTNSRIRKDTLFCNSRRTHYRSSSGRDRCGRHRSSRTSTAFALIANSPSHRGGHGASHHDDFGSSLSAASRPRQQASTNCHRSRTTTRRRKSSTTLSVFSAGAPGSPAPWASSTALYAKRRPYVDTDDDDYYPDSSRIEPPPARAFKRPFTGDEREPRRTSGPGRGRGAGPSGRAGTMAGRGVRTSGGRGVGRVSSLHATSAAGTVADAPPAQAPPAAPAVRQAGGGIPQNDPLVKGWKSAQVLLPSRDEFPSGGGRGSGQQMGGRGGETQGGFVQDFAKSGSGRSGSRGGRGGGRGGRGRGGRETPHVGMYKGADTVPWYIKEVQDKGLDLEGGFDEWWKDNLDPKALTAKTNSMKMDELKAQLISRGLPTTGSKAELADRLSACLTRFSLSDDNFQHAEVVDSTWRDEDLPVCFPQVYESLTEGKLEDLWRESVKKRRAERQQQDTDKD